MSTRQQSPSNGYRGLLVDWGGVLTNNIFDTFRSFCDLEGLAAELGMTTVHHVGSEQTIPQLERLLEVQLR